MLRPFYFPSLERQCTLVVREIFCDNSWRITMSLERMLGIFVIFDRPLGLDMFLHAVKIVTLEMKVEQETYEQARKDSIHWT